MFAKDYSTEEPCEILLKKFKNEIFDKGLHFRHEFKKWLKCGTMKSLRATNWQDTAAARTKNEAQSVI